MARYSRRNVLDMRGHFQRVIDDPLAPEDLKAKARKAVKQIDAKGGGKVGMDPLTIAALIAQFLPLLMQVLDFFRKREPVQE